MFNYIRSAIASRFDHPVLASMYLIAGFLAVIGAVLQFAIQPLLGSPSGVVNGFFLVYAIFVASIGTVGYAIIRVVRIIAEARDQMGPAPN
jgi:hypothetical protein